jgi:tRNA(Ile)-lysidine synthase
MDVKVEPGKYVVAVSGGVDSVSLLHVLRTQAGLELVVAHFDHGIRPDSKLDRQFVAALAEAYGLPFYFAEGGLGTDASEATAREARYAFLRNIRQQTRARAIITAHHQDDVLETAIINLLRGTGRKGLSSLRNRADIERPLLRASKADIQDYARRNRLRWREDSSNGDPKYLRNHVRLNIVPRLDGPGRAQLLGLVDKSGHNNEAIDALLVKYLSDNGSDKQLRRQPLIGLPHEVAREVVAAWLRANELRDFDRRTLERLVVGAKTGRPGSRLNVLRSVDLRIGRDNLALEAVER